VNLYKYLGATLMVLLTVSLTTSPALATTQHAKTYKTVFNQSKQPKCIVCHTAAQPKKTAGKHDVNDYGNKVKALLAPDSDPKKPDPEAYRAVGPAAS